jgi:hypothetical protein
MIQPTIIKWEEPNRDQTPPLHIADRGTRYSTLTGVTWLNEFQYLVAHRSGLRMGFFDLRNKSGPIKVFDLPHLTDDIASKPVGPNKWEVTVSGCWEAISSTFYFDLNGQPEIHHKAKREHTERTFSHGVRYDHNGELCVALHTGVDPRIELSQKIYRLPQPWGARCVCFDRQNNAYLSVAVCANPNLNKYNRTSTSIWLLEESSPSWKMIFSIDDVHSDACEVYKNRIWLADQKNDKVIGLCLEKKHKPIILATRLFDFPHGLSISCTGMMAVTNYGNSSVVLFDLNEVLRQRDESRQNH